MEMAKDLMIINSTKEFLTFKINKKEKGYVLDKEKMKK